MSPRRAPNALRVGPRENGLLKKSLTGPRGTATIFLLKLFLLKIIELFSFQWQAVRELLLRLPGLICLDRLDGLGGAAVIRTESTAAPFFFYLLMVQAPCRYGVPRI